MRLKYKCSLILLIYLIAVTICFAVMTYRYNYMEFKSVIFLLIPWVTGAFYVIDFDKTGRLITQGTVFNAFGLLYTEYYFVNASTNDIQIPNDVYTIEFLAVVAILSFNISYHITSNRKNVKHLQKNEYDLVRIRKLTALLMIISVLAEYWVLCNIGLDTVLNSSRSMVTLLMSDFGVFSFYRHTLPMLSGLYLLLYFKYKNRCDFLFFCTLFFISAVNAWLYASRANMLALLLPIIFLLEFYNKLSKVNIIFIFLAAFMFFGYWKGMISGNGVFQIKSEFASWIKIGENIIDENYFWLGSTYLDTIVNLIIPITHMESVSEWYVRTYEYDAYINGFGRGFSQILEAYINFGFLGIVFIFGVLGCLFKKIRLESDFSVMVYMIFLSSVYQLFRADAFSLWKNMMWFEIYPLALIFFLCKVRRLKKTITVNYEK